MRWDGAARLHPTTTVTGSHPGENGSTCLVNNAAGGNERMDGRGMEDHPTMGVPWVYDPLLWSTEEKGRKDATKMAKVNNSMK